MPGNHGPAPAGAPRQHEFDIGCIEVRRRLDERVQTKRQMRRRTGAHQITAQHRDTGAIEPHHRMEGSGLGTFPQQFDFEVILQTVADGQIGHRRDAERAQMLGRADTREHQQMRRIERTAAHEHFTRRFFGNRHAVTRVLDAVGFGAVEQHAVREGIREHGEIRPFDRVGQIRLCRRCAMTVANVELRAAEAPFTRIIIVDERIARLPRSFPHRREDGIRRFGVLDVDGARAARASRTRRLPTIRCA